MFFLPALSSLASGAFSIASKVASSNLGSSLLGGLGASAGGALGGKLLDKIFGVPTPPTGAELGETQKAFMDAAYPGTNAWERLGSGGGGSSSPASIASAEIKNQRQMQAREFMQQRSLTEMNNKASIVASTAPLGTSATKSALDVYSGKSGSDYDTQISLAKQKLLPEIANLNAKTQLDLQNAFESAVRARLTKNEADIKQADASLANEMAKAKLTGEKSKSITTLLQNFAENMGNAAYDFTQNIPLMFKPHRSRGTSGAW